jgi:hypothetical protein
MHKNNLRMQSRHIRHSRIKPQLVGVWIEDYWHPSWTGEVTAFGVVVRIEQVFIQAPPGSLQRSHNPAKANNCPSSISKQYGCFVFPARDHS